MSAMPLFGRIIGALNHVWTILRIRDVYRSTVVAYHSFLARWIADATSTSASKTTRPCPSRRPYFIPFTAPYLCTTSHYDFDDRGFWDFPERVGWALDATGYRNFSNAIEWAQNLAFLDGLYTCRRRKIPEELSLARPLDSLKLKCYRINDDAPGGYRYAGVSEQVAFLQAWLFFGMLSEISSICGLSIDLEAEFVVAGPAGSRKVCTAALDGLPQRWLDAADTRILHDPTTKHILDSDQAARIVRVVQHAMSMQTRYEDPRKSESRRLTYPECKVLLSIRMVSRAAVLTLAASEACDMVIIRALMDPQVQQSFPARWDELKQFAADELQREGWCRSECKLLERMDGSYEFFATSLKRQRMDHSQCDDFRCLADQVNEDVYETVHVEPGCRCASVVVDPEELQAVLAKGKVPRILVSEDCRLVVTENCPYAAISHVWSHGLGNPFENALPRCQIRRLNQHIAKLQVGGSPEARMALWIDTLCIPVAKSFRSYRNKAIVLLGKTYKDADAVLVLDRELEQLDTERASLLEQELLMSFVGWTRRLWTLQEAAQARKLFVQTLQGPQPVDVDHRVPSQELEEKEQAISQICFREEIQELIRNRIPSLPSLQKSTFQTADRGVGLPPISEISTSYQRLCFAVKHRSTSKMTDEAIILATIIGADTQEFLNVRDVNSRMSIFHTLMREIPTDIIFGDAERIGRAPFRWAPRSLLNFNIFRIQSFGPPAICDAHGLHATYEGLVLDGGSGAEAEEGKYYAEDHVTGMKYTFALRGDPHRSFRLPERPAFLLRYYCINNDVAVVNILRAVDNGDLEVGNSATAAVPYVGGGTDGTGGTNWVYEVTIVGYLELVASGGSWGIDGEPLTANLQGAMTGAEQRWLVT